MSVIGHGIDLVEVAALHRWIEDPRDPLVPRCFTADELAEIGEGELRRRIERRRRLDDTLDDPRRSDVAEVDPPRLHRVP